MTQINNPNPPECMSMQHVPPWADFWQWAEAVQVLDRLITMHRSTLKEAKIVACKIKTRLEAIFPLMDSLNGRTCPWCKDPCCLRAKPWINFCDLLFISLIKGPVPLRQLLSNQDSSCIYATKFGCTIPRLSRPFICLWYICPQQKAILSSAENGSKKILWDELAAIKSYRKAMEEMFIKKVVA